MKSFRFLMPDTTLIVLTLLLTLQITACTVEEPTDTSTDSSTSETTDTSGGTNDSGNQTGGGAGTSDTGSGSNHPAIITGTDSGNITEDYDPDHNNILEISGNLNITDVDTGEDGFISATKSGNYGSLAFYTNGNWKYEAENSQNAIQSMTSGDKLREYFTVSSIDGSTHQIAITISGSADAATISGQDTGSVTEDIDPDNDNMLEASGRLNISDADAGEAGFIGSAKSGNYGSLSIDADGNWDYAASNTQSLIQNMNRGDILQESFTISAIDGTAHDISISILGEDEPVADITLSWAAPVEREDNTALSTSEIAGYRVYVYRGSTQGELMKEIDIADGYTENHTFENFSSGTYYFIITSYDLQGRESQQGSGIQVII